MFKSGRNLKNILTSKNKTKLGPNTNPGIYRLSCSCGKLYVGETKLNISSRIYQHQSATHEGKWENSAVAAHAKDCHGHIEWNSHSNTVAIESRDFDRKVREALQIQYEHCSPKEGGMNQDNGQYVTTHFWKPLFKSVRAGQCLTSNI